MENISNCRKVCHNKLDIGVCTTNTLSNTQYLPEIHILTCSAESNETLITGRKGPIENRSGGVVEE